METKPAWPIRTSAPPPGFALAKSQIRAGSLGQRRAGHAERAAHVRGLILEAVMAELGNSCSNMPAANGSAWYRRYGSRCVSPGCTGFAHRHRQAGEAVGFQKIQCLDSALPPPG